MNPAATQTDAFAYVAGGTLPADAPYYVPRMADTQLLDTLRNGQLCYVLNARQMGKSSLCIRTLTRLQQENVHTVFLDLTRYGSTNLTSEQWYYALLNDVGSELGMRAEFVAHWRQQSGLPPVRRLFSALRELALERLEAPIVVFVDEIDVTRSLSFSTDEFFAAIRAATVERAKDTQWQRLTFCLIGTATPSDLIKDVTITPFNVGERIELRDFTAEEAAPLAVVLGVDVIGERLLGRVLYWTGGQPHMTQKLCQAVQERGCGSVSEVDAVVRGLWLSDSAQNSDDNLANVRNRLLRGYDDVAELLDLYGRVLSGKRVVDEESDPRCSVLKLSGAVKSVSGVLVVRNRVYATVFDRAWIASSLPDAELRRQREAYRRGVFRTLGLASIVVAVFLALALFAFEKGYEAERNALREKVARVEADRQRNIAIAERNALREKVEHTPAESGKALKPSIPSPYGVVPER